MRTLCQWTFWNPLQPADHLGPVRFVFRRVSFGRLGDRCGVMGAGSVFMVGADPTADPPCC
jgi:hypothetical protein